MREKKNKRVNLRNFLLNHINSNIKEYFTVLILFLTGLIIGIFIINNVNEHGNLEITNYMNTFINSLKSDNQVDKIALLKDSIFSNLKLRIIFMVCRFNINRNTNCIWNYCI